MSSLPPVAPVTGWRAATRLARDHYVRLDGNDYSVHPAVIGRRVEIIADLHRVRVLCDGRWVADYERLWAKHQTICDPEHVAAAKLLRQERIGLLPAGALLDRVPQAGVPGPPTRGRRRCSDRPGPAGSTPSTSARTVQTGRWACNAARAAAGSVGRSGSAGHARAAANRSPSTVST